MSRWLFAPCKLLSSSSCISKMQFLLPPFLHGKKVKQACEGRTQIIIIGVYSVNTAAAILTVCQRGTRLYNLLAGLHVSSCSLFGNANSFSPVRNPNTHAQHHNPSGSRTSSSPSRLHRIQNRNTVTQVSYGGVIGDRDRDRTKGANNERKTNVDVTITT